MKKYLFFALATVGLLASCNKNKVEAGPELPFNDDATPVPIQLATSTTTVEVKTKGMVETFTDGSEVYVYAQVRENMYETSVEEGSFITEDLAGILATTVDGAIVLGQYYTDKVIYDFYGYYLGDKNEGDEAVAVAGTIETAGTIPVTITGKADIMAAKANPETDLTADGVADEIKNRPALVYSAWSARRNVVPSLTFNHMLTALTVNVKLGTGGDTNIKVSKVAVTAPKEGTLTVIGTQAAVGAEPTPETPNAFVLENESAGTALPEYNEEDETTKQRVGTIMLFPSTVDIPLTVTFTQGTENTEQTSSVSIPLPPAVGDAAQQFAAGTHYTVDVIVYGNAPIEITTSITPWGETVILDDIDPDELPPLQ